ncbi:MAG: hypothetical protein DRJ35_07960 [Thermoprotei archaeon]|nr:MAG: hypothetical protein DRJ35_07960 [Thermoprotei archaeon]
MTNRDLLLSEAGKLGLTFAKNAKTETIQKAVDKANIEATEEKAFIDAGGSVEPAEAVPTIEEITDQIEKKFAAKFEMEKAKMQANMEVNIATKDDKAGAQRATIGQAKLRARKEALKLIRVVITVKDPAKQSWEGEIISAGNDVIGEVKKFIPYMNAEEGYHIPQIILNVLKDKECTVFVNRKGADGKMLKKAKQIKAYAFEYLEPLTPDELTELGRSQTDRQALD